MVVNVANIIATIGGIGAIVMLVWIAARGDRGRHSEDDARTFFDREGRWPDEPEDMAMPRPGGYGAVDDLDPERFDR